MELLVGNVISNADFTETGLFQVTIGKYSGGKPIIADVQYVSPFFSSDAGFVAIPNLKSQVLLAEKPADSISDADYFYLGCITGPREGVQQSSDISKDPGRMSTVTDSKKLEAIDANLDGMSAVQDDILAETNDPNRVSKKAFPGRFNQLYAGRGQPEVIGLEGTNGAAFRISDRQAGGDLQDNKIDVVSGKGKYLGLIDSPMIDAFVYMNEFTHSKGDILAFSSGDHPHSPWAQGEFKLRTHGPINQISTESNIKHEVVDGRNIEILNWSEGTKTPIGTTAKHKQKHSKIGDFGNEEYGCVHILSKDNNVTLTATGSDSVIRVIAPGSQSKVVVVTGGSVHVNAQKNINVKANKKITMDSNEEIEITAPTIILGNKGVGPGAEISGNLASIGLDSTGKIEFKGRSSRLTDRGHGGHGLHHRHGTGHGT